METIRVQARGEFRWIGIPIDRWRCKKTLEVQTTVIQLIIFLIDYIQCVNTLSTSLLLMPGADIMHILNAVSTARAAASAAAGKASSVAVGARIKVNKEARVAFQHN